MCIITLPTTELHRIYQDLITNNKSIPLLYKVIQKFTQSVYVETFGSSTTYETNLWIN